MRVFISIPMNGRDDDEVKNEIEIIKKEFAKIHVDAVDGFNDWNIDENTQICNKPIWYLGVSINRMSKCDAVYMAKGWQNARGCKIERQVAHEYGMKILDTDFISYNASTNTITRDELDCSVWDRPKELRFIATPVMKEDE